MTPRGRGGGHRPPNRGGRGVRDVDISLPNTNIPPSFVLPTTMESTHNIYEGAAPLPTLYKQDIEHHVGESNPTTFSTEPTMNQPSLIQDSLTPDNEYGNVVDQRTWLHAEKGE